MDQYFIEHVFPPNKKIDMDDQDRNNVGTGRFTASLGRILIGASNEPIFQLFLTSQRNW